MTHYTNTNNPIDFPKKKEIPMLEKFAAQSLVEYEGELIFSKEKFAELIVRECDGVGYDASYYVCALNVSNKIKQHFGVEE
jgi:hypothetical protein